MSDITPESSGYQPLEAVPSQEPDQIAVIDRYIQQLGISDVEETSRLRDETMDQVRTGRPVETSFFRAFQQVEIVTARDEQGRPSTPFSEMVQPGFRIDIWNDARHPAGVEYATSEREGHETVIDQANDTMQRTEARSYVLTRMAGNSSVSLEFRVSGLSGAQEFVPPTARFIPRNENRLVSRGTQPINQSPTPSGS